MWEGRDGRTYATSAALAVVFGLLFAQMMGPAGLVLGVALGVAMGEGDRRRRGARNDPE